MEFSLHRQLKELYAGPEARLEDRLDNYRIDVVLPGGLVEIQLGPLALLRRKAARLLESHNLLIVKPVVIGKQIVRLGKPEGPVLSRRRSPKRGEAWEFFHDLLHFCKVFPHPRLRIHVPLVEIEEIRYPGPNHRWGRRGYRVADQRLLAVRERIELRRGRDLLHLLPMRPDGPFHARDLADSLGVTHGVAQRIAYCLYRCGVARRTAKTKKGYVYVWCRDAVVQRAA
ncbi:MAG: hypothetical protein GYA33_09235 [Thermogutta sp.]|nr:hypothetical protein [Thermogutta sp.]